MDGMLAQAIRDHIARAGGQALKDAGLGDLKGGGAFLDPVTVARIVRQEVAARITRAGSIEGHHPGDVIARLIETGVLMIDTARAATLSEQGAILTESPPCQHFARPHVEPPPPVPPEGCVETVTAPRLERRSAVDAVAAKLTAAYEALPPLYAEEAGPAHVGFTGQFSAQIRTPGIPGTRVAEVVADLDGRCGHAWTINKLARQMAAAPELVALLGAVLPYARSRLEAIEEDAMADLDAPHDVGAKAEEAARKARAAIGAADRLLERIHAPTHPADLKL